MTSKVSYSSLYELVVNEIESRTKYSQGLRTSEQLKRPEISPLTGSSISDITSAAIVNSVQTLLAHTIRPRIISGLYVKATNPISSSVVVEVGRGVSYGRYYETKEDITVPIPFDNKTEVFYVVLFDNTIIIDKSYDFKKLILAKIIVPNPGVTSFIVNNRGDEKTFDAYIVNQQDYYLHGDKYGKFEEDTVELLRDNISPILADNLIGNIRLSEDLKIINSSGTLELDSREMRLKSTSGNRLMRLNKNGTFFYDDNGVEIARFSVDGARVGNIVVTKNSIQSGDFVSGALGTGFQIQDNGDAEFNNIRARGKFTTSVFEKETISSVGGNLLVADSDILDLDMTALDDSTLTITGDTTFDVGDILRIKDGVDDEWIEVTDASSAPTYTVTRDKAEDYTSDLNPIWKKGTAVINYGSSTDGMIYMTASESNAPYMSVINTGTTPWIAPTTRLRVGNLNGFLGYTEDAYGIAIGDINEYLKYDPVNGLRIKGDVTITSGTVIPVTFYQDEEPPTSGQTVKDGDYWVDTDDSNKLYLREADSWTVISQSGGGGGGGGGISSFVQSATATGEGIPTSLAEGDLWLNTDNNRLYRAASSGADEITAGEWELTLSSVGSTPDIEEGLYLSADYLGYFDGEEWKAYIKNDGTFHFGGTENSGDGFHYIDWNGATLTIRGVLDAEDIVSGYIDADRIEADSITADKIIVDNLAAISANIGSITSGSLDAVSITGTTITGGTIQTATSGARIVITANSFIAYDDESSGNEIFKILTSGSDSGDVILGDYDNSKGAKWDSSEETFNVKGQMTITSGDITGKLSVGSNLDIEGENESVRVYGDTVTIEAGVNDDLDWTENGSTKTADLDAGDYTPTELAAEIQAEMRAAGDSNTTVTYSSTTRKITIANSTLTTLTFLWSSGANKLTTCGRAIGFDTTADDTGALTYTADIQCALRVELGLLQ